MRTKRGIRLGFAPTRRVLTTPTAFNREVAIRIKDEIQEYLKRFEEVELVTLDGMNEEGLLSDPKQADRIGQYFLENQVDAMFFPHCNFGSEEAVAKVARIVGKPVLIWGPRDDAPDSEGNRYTDTQCGMFATTKVLGQFGVKYTYIGNCKLTDWRFTRGFKNFLGAVSVVRAMSHLRIGQIGTRPEIFWSVKVNERELMEKFGIEIVPITMTDLSRMLQTYEAENREAVWTEAESLETRFGDSGYSREDWKNIANLKLTIRDWCRENDLSAVAAQCWKPMDTVAHVAPCFVFSELTGEGIPVICESDIHGAVSSVIAAAAVQDASPTFLADLTVRHPENDNAELLWHCGVFPHKLAGKTDNGVGTHFNRRNPAVGQWELKHDDITLVRFDGAYGEYSCLFGQGKGVDGPKTFGTYLWAEFENWPLWERKFMEGPYIHHCAGVYGNAAAAIWEACKYIPHLKADPVKPDADQLREYLL